MRNLLYKKDDRIYSFYINPKYNYLNNINHNNLKFISLSSTFYIDSDNSLISIFTKNKDIIDIKELYKFIKDEFDLIWMNLK